jgi:hypothetical protein
LRNGLHVYEHQVKHRDIDRQTYTNFLENMMAKIQLWAVIASFPLFCYSSLLIYMDIRGWWFRNRRVVVEEWEGDSAQNTRHMAQLGEGRRIGVRGKGDRVHL